MIVGQRYTVTFDTEKNVANNIHMRAMSGGVEKQLQSIHHSQRTRLTFIAAGETVEIKLQEAAVIADNATIFILDNFDIDIWDDGVAKNVVFEDRFHDPSQWTHRIGTCANMQNGRMAIDNNVNICNIVSKVIAVKPNLRYQLSADIHQFPG